MPGSTKAEILLSAIQTATTAIAAVPSNENTTHLTAQLDIIAANLDSDILQNGRKQRVLSEHPTAPIPPSQKAATQYKNFLRNQIQPAYLLNLFQFIGRTFTDNQSNETFRISNVVFPKNTPTDSQHMTAFFRYYDTKLYNSPPSPEINYEHTPATELVSRSQTTKAYNIKPNTWATWDEPYLVANFSAPTCNIDYDNLYDANLEESDEYFTQLPSTSPSINSTYQCNSRRRYPKSES